MFEKVPIGRTFLHKTINLLPKIIQISQQQQKNSNCSTIIVILGMQLNLIEHVHMKKKNKIKKIVGT